MSRFQRLRTQPHFAPWFAQVHPLFWPLLWWQLETTVKWMNRVGIFNVLITLRT